MLVLLLVVQLSSIISAYNMSNSYCVRFERNCSMVDDDGFQYKGHQVVGKTVSLVDGDVTHYDNLTHLIGSQVCARATVIADDRYDSDFTQVLRTRFSLTKSSVYHYRTGQYIRAFFNKGSNLDMHLHSRIVLAEGMRTWFMEDRGLWYIFDHTTEQRQKFDWVSFTPSIEFVGTFWKHTIDLLQTYSRVTAVQPIMVGLSEKFMTMSFASGTDQFWERNITLPYCDGEYFLFYDSRIVIHTLTGIIADRSVSDNCASYKWLRVPRTFFILMTAEGVPNNPYLTSSFLCFSGRVAHRNELHIIPNPFAETRNIITDTGFASWTCSCAPTVTNLALCKTAYVTSTVNPDQMNKDSLKFQQQFCGTRTHCLYHYEYPIASDLTYPSDVPSGQDKGSTAVKTYMSKVFTTCGCHTGRGFKDIQNVSLPQFSEVLTSPEHCGDTYVKAYAQARVHVPPFQVADHHCRVARGIYAKKQVCFILCVGWGKGDSEVTAKDFSNYQKEVRASFKQVNDRLTAQHNFDQKFYSEFRSTVVQEQAFEHQVKENFVIVDGRLLTLEQTSNTLVDREYNNQVVTKIQELQLKYIEEEVFGQSTELQKKAEGVYPIHGGCVYFDAPKHIVGEQLVQIDDITTQQALSIPTGTVKIPDIVKASGSSKDGGLSTTAMVIIGVVVFVIVVIVGIVIFKKS